MVFLAGTQAARATALACLELNESHCFWLERQRGEAQNVQLGQGLASGGCEGLRSLARGQLRRGLSQVTFSEGEYTVCLSLFPWAARHQRQPEVNCVRDS